MNNREIKLQALDKKDIDQFVTDNQIAFKYGALEEFGLRDDHFEEDGEIISKETIKNAIIYGDSYWICINNNRIGGCVVKADGDRGYLELLFINPSEHSKGYGQDAWKKIEKQYSDVRVWETFTPYFEKRNIHFYVNKCGFRIVDFFCEVHHIPEKYKNDESEEEYFDMLRFEKVIGEVKHENFSC